MINVATKPLAESLKEMNRSILRASLPCRVQKAYRATVPSLLFLLTWFAIVINPVPASAQNSSQAGSADNALRSGMRVDSSTRAMNIQIPIRVYPGRAGMSVPITLNYSSKVWRMESVGVYRSTCGGENGGARWVTKMESRYGQYSAAGWTTSVGIPQVEWPKDTDVYNWDGKPVCVDCHSPRWNEANYWVIDRLYMHMPDGSTHEMRKSDTPHHWPVNRTGKFYAIDDSRLIYDADTKILYQPDGARYEGVDSTVSGTIKLIDRNGNTLVYNATTGQWTDTLGRTISLPTLGSSSTYTVQGVGNSSQNYILRWTNLSSALTVPQDLKYNGEVITGGTTNNCGDPQSVPSPGSLWGTSEDGTVIQTPNQPFNPVVLHEIELPNGSLYRFTYNVYGEIDKIELPTGGTEQFNYEPVSAISTNTSSRSNRGVKDHRARPINGSSAGEQFWQYSTANVLSQDQTHVIYKVRQTAPDTSYTDRYLFNGTPSSAGLTGTGLFGFDDIRNGRPFDERVYSSTGQLMRRKLTEWGMSSTQVPGPTPPHSGSTPVTATAIRSPKVKKEVAIIFDTGTNNSLLTMTTYQYDQASQPLNLTSTTQYGFSSLDSFTAENSPVESFSPNSSLALRTSQTSYLEHSDYTARNLVALPKITTVKTGGLTGAIVAKSIFEYDEYNEGAYPLLTYGTVTGWTNPQTTARGNVTTTSNLKDVTENSYITTHTRYDQCGSVRESIDARSNVAKIEYTDSFFGGEAHNTFAYPTSVITPVPDASGQHALNSELTSSTVYDFKTGTVLESTDANDQKTKYSYVDEQNNNSPDPLGRLRKMLRADNSWTRYEYGEDVGDLYVMTETQQDAARTVKSYQYFDGLGRPSRSLLQENGTNYIARDTKYDRMGRVCAISNPYRTQSTGAAFASSDNCEPASNWTTTTYDPLGRVNQVTLSDLSTTQTDYLGIYTTVTDKAGKKRRQKVNALGQIVRVDEPDTTGNLGDLETPAQATSYDYDTLGNLVHVTQGSGTNTQHRYFRYDALSRLTYERQVEQAAIFSQADPLTGNNQWSRKLVYDETIGAVSFTGLLTSQYDARNIRTRYAYDNLSRITQISYTLCNSSPCIEEGTPAVSYFYDSQRFTVNGNTTQVRNRGRLGEVKTEAKGNLPSTSQAYNYDLMGRVVQNRQTVGTINPYTMLYGYNLAGALTSQQYPSGNIVTTEYDDAARLKNVAGNGKTYASQFDYADSRGLLSSFVLGTNGNVGKQSYTYNSRLQLSSIELSKGSSVLQRYEYKYGQINALGALDETKNNGQIAQIESFIGTQKQWQQKYEYDSLARLSRASEYNGSTSQRTYQMNYEYDAFGNRYQKQASNPDSLPFVPVDDNHINKQTNRFTIGITNSDYDGAGNILKDEKFTNRLYQYDANNRQRQVSQLDGTGAVISVYDGAGQRVATMTGSNVDNVLVYAADGKLMAEYNQAPVNRGTSYVLTDHQSSTRVVTDGTGAVISRHDYDPFGGEIGAGVGARGNDPFYGQADGARQKYAGMETDDGSTNSHTLWRKYDSKSGRWTSPDPYGASMMVADPQSFNRYIYVNNDPVNQTDPSGLMAYSGADVGWSGYQGLGGGFDFNSRPSFGRENIENGMNGFPDRQEEEDEEEEEPQQQGEGGNPSIRQNGNPADAQTDVDLGPTFTDPAEGGFVRGASPRRNLQIGDTHFRLADGTIHTIHVYGDATGNKIVGVYIPDRFTDVKYVGTRMNSVVAIDPKTNDVIRISHVRVYSQKELLKNLKKTNKAGSRFIGNIGGPQGNGAGDRHAHLTFFKGGQKGMEKAMEYKYSESPYGEYDSKVSQYMGNFRTFLKRSR